MLESTLRFVSIVASLVIVAAWLAFAIDQTREGSDASQQGIAAQIATPTKAQVEHHGGARKALDRADRALVKPFDGIVSPSAGAWARHTVPALLGLALYGFGLGYLARFARGRGYRRTALHPH